MGLLLITIISFIVFFILMLFCFYGKDWHMPSFDLTSLAKKYNEYLSMKDVREKEREYEERKKERAKDQEEFERREQALNRLNQLEIDEMESRRMRKIMDRQKIVRMNTDAMDIWERDFLRSQGLLDDSETLQQVEYGPVEHRSVEHGLEMLGPRQAYRIDDLQKIYRSDYNVYDRLIKQQETEQRYQAAMQSTHDHWDLFKKGMITKNEFLEKERMRMGVPDDAEMHYEDGVLTIDNKDRRLGDVTIYDHVSLSKRNTRDLQRKLKEERWSNDENQKQRERDYVMNLYNRGILPFEKAHDMLMNITRKYA